MHKSFWVLGMAVSEISEKTRKTLRGGHRVNKNGDSAYKGCQAQKDISMQRYIAEWQKG